MPPGTSHLLFTPETMGSQGSAQGALPGHPSPLAALLPCWTRMSTGFLEHGSFRPMLEPPGPGSRAPPHLPTCFCRCLPVVGPEAHGLPSLPGPGEPMFPSSGRDMARLLL